jgi:hypothetical protein
MALADALVTVSVLSAFAQERRPTYKNVMLVRASQIPEIAVKQIP